ncbi:hypothetical protein FOCC_FOCC015563 [Frankliniella occidentalis]|nr:hypothetical protein FOCC_FOCC015563 [Frankliniella occidentalis]
MLTLFEEALATVTPEVWQRVCEKIEKRIVETYETELKNEDPVNPLKMVISLDGNDSDDEDEDDSGGGWETYKTSHHFGPAEDVDAPDDPRIIHIVKPPEKR